MKFEYLIFNIIVFLPAFLIKLFFFKNYFIHEKKIWRSITLTALIFIVKDIFSNNSFWSFNHQYIIGIKLFGLPIEEIMFFFTVSYSTLFIYMILETIFKDKKINLIVKINRVFFFTFFLFVFFCLIIGKWYSFYILLFFYFTFSLLKKKLSLNIIRFYFIVFLLTLIFNLYLTARPVVIYNDKYILGWRLLTIPVEDFFYSFSFFNMLIYFLGNLKKPLLKFSKS